MDHPEPHSRALEMNRKEVGWARRALGVGRGLGQTSVCPQGFHLLVALCTPWGPAPTPGPGSTELGKVCAALTSLMGQLGLQPRLSEEFRGPLSQRFEEGSGFCIPERIKAEG